MRDLNWLVVVRDMFYSLANRDMVRMCDKAPSAVFSKDCDVRINVSFTCCKRAHAITSSTSFSSKEFSDNSVFRFLQSTVGALKSLKIKYRPLCD